MWLQRDLALEPRPRGVHLITREVTSAIPELRDLTVGLLHVQILHTSASLTINENASPDVRHDLEPWLSAELHGEGDLDAAQPARLGEGARLRFDLLRAEHS